MNLRTLLVLLDGSARSQMRAHLAARFAAAHGSHLVGVAPARVSGLDGGSGAASRYLDEAAASRVAALHRAQMLVEQFNKLCHTLGVASFEAAVYEGEPEEVVLHHAHCADATVIGQPDPASASHRDERRFVEHVLLRNARPTLIIPCRGRFDCVGDNVVVAWDESRASARATADAVPLLRHARRVHLCAWRREGEGAEDAVRQRLEAVQCWLSRQGVVAQVQVYTTAAAVGQAILGHAAALSADLVVMGTYGHSRWSERLLGGVTRTALMHSTVPLLMSH